MPARRLLLALIATALVAGACGGEDGSLTVYSGRSENLISPLLDQFTDETGIEVEVRYGGSADLALLIDQEGDQSPADVFISQSPGAIGFLAGEGRLVPIGDGVLGLVDDQFRSSDGLWVGMSGRIRVVVYNTDLVDPSELPSSVFDLTSEHYRGRVALAPENGSFQDFVTAMRDVHGDETTAQWLADMAANDVQRYSGNTPIVQAVGRGEVEFGLVNHYYNLRAQVEDPSVVSENHFLPAGDIGALVVITGIGITDTADDREVAERLVEFMLGMSAQEFFSNETLEYPLAAGVSAADGVPPLDSVGLTTYDFDELGGGLERTKELIDESGLSG